jgi:16S rRNA (cytidine1402-2'-O)-methyltransferase
MHENALQAGLYVAATPIGNLGDVSARLKAVLAAADLVLCEDTRVAGKLLQALGIKRPLRPYHDHNGAQVRPGILDELATGKAYALISDAGTPLIADPGFKLVREARARGIAVFAVPGPCAAIAALSIAGVPSDRFSFQGFLPPRSGARQTRLAQLRDRDETLIFYETGPRLAAMLADIATVFGDAQVVIGRELTKLHEEVVEGAATDLAARYAEATPRGEIVVIVSPAERAAADIGDADTLMREALATQSLKDAAAAVAARTGLKKRDLYQRWRERRD